MADFKRVVGSVQNDYFIDFFVERRIMLALRKACKWWKSSVADRGIFFWLRNCAIEQCFQPFFGSRPAPLGLKKILRHFGLAKMTIFSSQVVKHQKGSKINIWWQPIHLFTAPNILCVQFWHVFICLQLDFF